MARTMVTPQAEDVAGENTRLEAEGYFHCFIKDVKDGQVHYGDEAVEGFSAFFQVVEGEHKDKTLGTTLRDGLASHSDGGDFCRRIQAAFCIAANLLTPSQLNGGQASFDEQNARNQQVIIKVKLGKEKNGKRYHDLDGTHIYHVDDPRVKDVPKNAEALALLPPALRHDEAYFEPLLPKGRKPAASAASGGTTAAPVFDPSGL